MNNMYDILAVMKTLTESKKPDFLDVDKDGDKKEPFKKAVADKKKVSECEGGSAADEWYDAKGQVDPNGAYDAGGHFHAERNADAADFARDELNEKWGSATKVSPEEKGKYAGKDKAELLKSYNALKKSGPHKKGSPEFGRMRELAFAIRAKSGWGKVAEGDVEEGNEYTGARLAAIRAGKPTFSVGGKTYRVTGDTQDEKVMESRVTEREFKNKGDLETQGKVGDTYKTAKGTVTKTKTGVKHERSGEEEPEVKDDDKPRKRGRPAGTKRSLGAKGPTGKSKLMKVKETHFGRDKAAFDDHGQAGDTYDTDHGTLTKTKTGVIHRRRHEEEPKDTGKDDGAPRRRGRPAGTKRSLGAKGPTGRSKLMREEEAGGDIQAAIELLMNNGYTIGKLGGDDAGAADQFVSDYKKGNVPANFGDKASQGPGMRGGEQVAEKAVSKAQQKFMGMVHAAQKGEKAASPEVAKVAKSMGKKDVKDFASTKHKGLPEKKAKKEVEETTTSGSVATAPAEGGKKSKGGVQFGKGVYEGAIAESFDAKLTNVLNEGMDINVHVDREGNQTISVTAEGEDALHLAQILKLAGLEQSTVESAPCESCGQVECACGQVTEGEPANAPQPGYSNAEMMLHGLSGGLNGPKSSGQTTGPVVNREPQRQGIGAVAESIAKEHESKLWTLYNNIKNK